MHRREVNHVLVLSVSTEVGFIQGDCVVLFFFQREILNPAKGTASDFVSRTNKHLLSRIAKNIFCC